MQRDADAFAHALFCLTRVSVLSLPWSSVSAFVGRARGFPNLGNTCYINSVLQCFYHCEPFRHDLEQQSEGQDSGQPRFCKPAKKDAPMRILSRRFSCVVHFAMSELCQMGCPDDRFRGKEAHANPVLQPAFKA